jgi:cell division protein FtsB
LRNVKNTIKINIIVLKIHFTSIFPEKQHKDTLIKERDDFKKNKNALKTELTNVEKEKDKLEEENKNLEEKLEKVKETQKDILELIINQSIVLDLSNSSDLSKLETLSNMQLPAMRKIKLDKVPSNNSTVKFFVKNSISNKVELFNFNTKGSTINGSDYFECLKSVLPKITKEIFIEDLTLSQPEFEEIVKTSSQCERLTFYACTIPTDSQCDFEIQDDYKIKYLSFRATGASTRSAWDYCPKRFS